MSEKEYSLLVATIGEPWGYRAAVYSIDGSEVSAIYTATALTKKYKIKKAMIVGLDSVAFPQDSKDQSIIMSRIDELKKANQGPDRSIFSFFRKGDEDLYRKVLMMELSAKEKFLAEKPPDVYSFFLEQDGYKLDVEKYEVLKVNSQNIAAKVAEGALAALKDIDDEELNVLLDITHGLNWLPLQTEKGLELGLKLASFTYSKSINLDVFSSQSIRKVASDPAKPERGAIVKLSEASFHKEESLREVTWSLLDSFGKLKHVPLLAFFLELSAPIAVVRYVNESWSDIEKDYAGSSDEIGVAARYFSEWLRSTTSFMWTPGTGISMENIMSFIKKVIRPAYPIGEALLEKELKKLRIIMGNAKLKFANRLRLCELLKKDSGPVNCKSSCTDQIEIKDYDLRNFIAHAGFDDLSVCVRYENDGFIGKYSFDYDDKMWTRLINEAEKYLSARRLA